jgi:hypothetical protein
MNESLSVIHWVRPYRRCSGDYTGKKSPGMKILWFGISTTFGWFVPLHSFADSQRCLLVGACGNNLIAGSGRA